MPAFVILINQSKSSIYIYGIFAVSDLTTNKFCLYFKRTR